MREDNHQNLSVHTVLVRPLYSRNVGHAARATLNMGFGKVFLIDPKCEIDEEARQAAAGAQQGIEERSSFENWEQFNKAHPNAFRIGMTRRLGKQRKIFPFEIGVDNYFKSLVETQQKTELPNITKEVFLIFGPEDHGLSNEDLDSVNICCHLPLYGNFKSLNLAQAVLLSQHLVHHNYFKNHLNSFTAPSKEENADEEIFKTEFFPDEALLGWLKTLGFRIDPDKLNAFETLKKMILRGFPSPKELGTLEKALRQSIKKLKI